jgi:type IV secretion system protein VirB9
MRLKTAVLCTLLAAPLLAALASCATVDVEKKVRADSVPRGGGKAGKTGEPLVIQVETPPPAVVQVERPVFIPESEAPKPTAKPVQGRAAVEESNAAGIAKPSEYSRAAMVYDYDPDWVYEVYTQPLRVSDLRLEPGEKAAEPPFISDSERWMAGAGVSYENGVAVQHIYIKPAEAELEATLIINTDRRAYHIILRSFRDVHMPMVRWRYPFSGMPNSYIAPPQSAGNAAASVSSLGPDPEGIGADPRFLSFNYRITYGWLQKPKWLPELVYDDGKKTYVTFPEDVLQDELPAVFENRSDVVNYRVIRNIIIIDKLIESVTVKKENTEITVTKKKG